MLVLSRKIGETIVVGDDIRITVVEIRGGKVRIGIVAPAHVIVNRQEIHDKRLNTLNEWADPIIYQPVA
jgi:carbon storage regulator